MKTIRLLTAAGLALAALLGVVWAVTWGQPTTARAEDAAGAPAVPQTLPPPWLSDDDVADAPFNAPIIGPPSIVDGRITPGEYAGAGKVAFPGYGGDVEVFFKQDGSNLYVAFELPDEVNHIPVPHVSIFLDTNNDGGSDPQTDDFWFLVRRNGGVAEWQGTGSTWNPNAIITWTHGLTETMSGWSVEFGIPFAKLGINAGAFKVLGLALKNGGIAPIDHYWPAGAFWANPDTWGSLVSSSEWSTFYWKPGPWEDYAPSGMPDFDQRQIVTPTYCGPFAAANSLWWFDSKFETPDHPPPPISDTYRLVWAYGDWDDHDTSNTLSLAKDLAWYFDTDGVRTGGTWLGTYVTDMHSGTLAYLRDHGLWDDYIVTLVEQPEFEWVADEVQRSEDVILLLGFWEEQPEGSGNWVRIGGHYVTVAGVDPWARQIAFSDPAQDFAEQPWGNGRVLSGTLIPHHPPHTGVYTIHNDAGNVSHDVYAVLPESPSPGGSWWIPEYVVPPTFLEIPGLNPNPRWEEPPQPWMGEFIHTEIEYALAVSPHTWKASGYWEGEFEVGNWNHFDDYAPNGVPDFDQKQDNWVGWVGPPFGNWTFCGPVAAANSLWWFDSRFEPNPISPPTYNDNYPLVKPYGLRDDHDPLNVDDPNTSWPPGGEFVEDLALYFQTDQSGSGTYVQDLYAGIEQYITDHGLRQGYVITQVKSPEFWWVAEEVEVSEDVILLLGFWQLQGPERWVRLGGHYVTLPGVDKQGGFVAFSDPWFDRIGQTWPYAGGPWPGWPSYMGRVADGRLIPHPPYGSHASTVHNDAGNVSHDVYNVVGSDSPGGVWGPGEYVDGWGSIENFWGQNGQEEIIDVTGDPIQAEVEWAVAVSPVADVFVKKAVNPPVVVPRDWVTFTIAFGNEGNDAENVVISDVLPSGLINASYTYTLNYLGTLMGHDTFTWTVGTLRYLEGGVITITAQVDPTITDPQRTITNTVEIATTTQEQYQVPEMPNSASAPFTVQTADVEIAKSVVPPTLHAGEWLTYTLVYTNHGPAAAANTIITDLLHSWLVTSSYGIWTSYIGAVFTPTGHYVWPMGDVPASGWGIITVTAQVSPTLSGGGTLPNTASISTDTPERDYTNNSASASNTVVYYGVDLQPDSAGITESPGKTVTYMLVLYNTGNVTDTYDITGTVSERPWTTTWPTTPVGPVAGSGSAQFTVTVQIPSGASDGDWSRAVITATSQGDATKSDASVLTTTATTQVITRGVAVAPHAAAQAGRAGTTVTYTLRVTNTGSVADVIGLSHTGPSTWTVGYSANPLSLVAGAGQDVEVYVGIPSLIAGSTTGIITVTATSQGDPAESDAAVLTTTVFWRFIYLPVVLRNYP